MTDNLFRMQVIEARNSSREIFGQAIASTPSIWTWFIATMATCFLVFCLFASVTEISRVETVRGYLRSDLAEAQITAIESGTISALLINEGDTVEVGTPLLYVRNDRFLSDGRPLEAGLVETLREELSKLLASRPGLQTSSELRIRGFNNIAQEAKRAIDQAHSELALLQNEQTIIAQRLEKTQVFFSEGLVTEDVVFDQRNNLMGLRQQVSSIEREIERHHSNIRQSRLDIDSEHASLENEKRSLDLRVSELNRLIEERRSREGYQILAPSEGHVTALQVREGETVDTNQFLLAISPLSSELVAEVHLPSSTIALVKPGLGVQLKFDALPHQRFGRVSGQVVNVSSTALRSDQLFQAEASQTLLYPAQLSVEQTSLSAFGKELPLQSGMEFDADIVLEKRRVLQWIFPDIALKSRNE